MRKLSIFLVLLLLLSAFRIAKTSFFSYPSSWPEPSYSFENNALKKEKIELGRALFYDPILSSTNEISCASCHSPYNAFTHADHALSHGVFDSIGNRNSPALMNLAWQGSFMWDGAINHLDMQSLAPISNEDEMASSIEDVVFRLQKSSIYPKLFDQAFGDSLATGQHTLQAIAQFMLTLVSTNSKYDKVQNKEAEFSSQEKKGYSLFQQHCNTCHLEPLFSTYGFANNGLLVDPLLKDSGRYLMSKSNQDIYSFKIPSLRNLEYSFPYMHDGRYTSLNQVLNHYNSNTKNEFVANSLKEGLNLSANEKVDLIAFLLTLSDKEFIFNQDFSFPREVFLNK